MSDLQTMSEQASADNKARREQRTKDAEAQTKQIEADRAQQEKMNLAKMEADAKLRPTPTPEEVAKARAGHNVDVKEPDGAPLQNERHPIANAAQQIEVGREIPTAAPVGSTQDQANQNNAMGRAAPVDRSDVSSSSSSTGANSSATGTKTDTSKK
jgi:hypothetical protein